MVDLCGFSLSTITPVYHPVATTLECCISCHGVTMVPEGTVVLAGFVFLGLWQRLPCLWL